MDNSIFFEHLIKGPRPYKVMVLFKNIPLVIPLLYLQETLMNSIKLSCMDKHLKW